MDKEYWYEKNLDNEILSKQDLFNKNERVPDLQEFITKLYVSDLFKKPEFDGVLILLIRKINLKSALKT